ncbi:hypothetical protein Tel_02720 [Candidatus Tenderia electrophaga]|jgi:broad specificity phosphatase PhoE|uniref:Phosphoglycerate mutase n=1 Tax=Candidatus Tenderia electrophaga TaxID=1748243 RepID=A0A0S2TAG4_9GAMM|nr:hypothetical protein Tel_02720 [Candidatus Tenderia electrophaga]
MTAEVIASYHSDCQIAFDKFLMERHFGVWEGLYFDEIESKYPVQHQAWKRNQAAFKPEAGESVYDLAERVRLSLKQVIADNQGKCIVVVSHVGPIRTLIASAVGMPLERYRQISVDPASVSCVDYGRRQNNLILLNFHGRHWGGGWA